MSFIPATKHFVGFRPSDDVSGAPNDGIRQGTDWSRAQTFVDKTGASIDMSAFQPGFGGLVRASFKSADRSTTYFSTAAGTVVLTWLDQYTLEVRVPAAASAAIAAPTNVAPGLPARTIPNTAIYSIEGVSGITGRTERLMEGRFEMDREVVLTGT